MLGRQPRSSVVERATPRGISSGAELFAIQKRHFHNVGVGAPLRPMSEQRGKAILKIDVNLNNKRKDVKERESGTHVVISGLRMEAPLDRFRQQAKNKTPLLYYCLRLFSDVVFAFRHTEFIRSNKEEANVMQMRPDDEEMHLHTPSVAIQRRRASSAQLCVNDEP
ncbi:hypothetical protein OBBRIDRAFT_329099 [Obba rivulosa]|uniref:Uncharacterized protein n=1 Tax=Obba rivulosa TaxID=1052685 RepID=A0A8E2DPH7_9APHY|nr:hypothetical protein OBBRIDRAFT_329099 [Obba rivulosa]